MALNKKGGLGKGLGKGIDSLISNAYAVETKKKRFSSCCTPLLSPPQKRPFAVFSFKDCSAIFIDRL